LKKLYEIYYQHHKCQNFCKYSIEFFLSIFTSYFYYNQDLQCEINIYSSKNKNEFNLRFRNYRENGLCAPNFTYNFLLEKVLPKNIIELFKLILLEKKIVIISNDYNNNALIIESLLSLIFPL